MPTTFFRDNLLRFLPIEHQLRDFDSGDLSDFLKIVAIPLDDFTNFVEQFTSIFDVDTCDPKYLPYLAKMVNYPLSDRDDVASKRLQLKNAVEFYKRKGLHESFRILFYSLGYVINLVELWTKDYSSFFRYPGSWTPPIFPASVVGTNLVLITINEANRNLRISIDGSLEIPIALTVGPSRSLLSIAEEIDAALDVIEGDCFLVSGKIKIVSRRSGEFSSVRVIDVTSSAYQILKLGVGTYNGIDYNVPDDWPELQENGGEWYKSPHFGIEVYSIKGYVTDPEEFNYIRERLELVRPIHTVLDFINYAKDVTDSMGFGEDEQIAQLESKFVDPWPYAVCMDRGVSSEYLYRRNGLVPNRTDYVRVLYGHKRKSLDNAPSRESFVYDVFQLSREFPSGPPQMPDRSVGIYARDGYLTGDPTRESCSSEQEIVDFDMIYDDEETWCTKVYRDGGMISRDNPTDYTRDGSFTLITWRGQSEFYRGGDHPDFTRATCKPPLETELGEMLFCRSDLPGVYSTSLSDLNDPFSLGIFDEIPFPGEGGPGL